MLKNQRVGKDESKIFAIVFISLISFLTYYLLPYSGYRAIGPIFLVSILVVSVFASRLAIFFSALTLAFVWNFFFIPPQFTFAIHAWEDITMLISFFVTALIGGILNGEIQKARVLKASDELHKTLLNSVSHELRTPITSIIGSASALREYTLLKTEAREALTTNLIESAHRLDQVVENLLDLSRLEKGSLHLKKEWFDLADLFESIKANIKNDKLVQRLKFKGESFHLLEGDFYLLSHAIFQIVLNGLKYSRDNVEIVSNQEKGITKISVYDSGKGIPQEFEKNIFEKFYRLPGTAAGGLGLGLSISKNIIDLHGGVIKVRRNFTQGSIFEIFLPSRPAPLALQKELM